MRRIIYTDPDINKLVMVFPNPAAKYTEEYILNHKPSVPERALHARAVDVSALPDMRLFDAFMDSGKKVSIDMGKGKIIAHEIRRKARTIAFADNLEVIHKDSLGIPLEVNGKTVQAARDENQAYKEFMDDVAQIAIDAATNEEGLLQALDALV